MVKRLVAQELTLSFVPDVEQRLWRTVMRRRTRSPAIACKLQNRLEALLEEAHIKVSSLVSDLLGVSARRMLQALAEGETDPGALATLAAARLPATPEQLCDAAPLYWVHQLEEYSLPVIGLPYSLPDMVCGNSTFRHIQILSATE